MSRRFGLMALVIILMVSGCKKVLKDVNEYYPKVETTSATVNPDGTVTVSAKLLSAGADELYAIGFCLDTVPNPGMLRNQQITEQLNDNICSTTYLQLDGSKSYYVRAWALNKKGYSFGNDLKIDKPGLDTSIIPCRVARNTLQSEGSGVPVYHQFYEVSAVESSSIGWSLEAHTSTGPGFHIVFSKAPTTGIYKTAETLPSLNEKRAYVQIGCIGGLFSGMDVKSGISVYVNQIGQGKIQISLCDAIIDSSYPDRYSFNIVSPL